MKTTTITVKDTYMTEGSSIYKGWKLPMHVIITDKGIFISDVAISAGTHEAYFTVCSRNNAYMWMHVS